LEVFPLENLLLKSEKGSVPWIWLVGIVVVLAIGATAIQFIPKPVAPAPIQVVARAKVPQLPPAAPAESQAVSQEVVEEAASAEEDPVPTQDSEDSLEPLSATAGSDAQAAEPEANTPPLAGQRDVAAGGVLSEEDVRDASPSAALADQKVAAVTARPAESAALVAVPAKAFVPDKDFADVVQRPKSPFAIQMGLFRTKAYADGLLTRLHQLGYAPYIQEFSDTRKGLLYAVRAGSYDTRAQAAAAAAVFKDKEKMAAIAVPTESF
jgi:cell division septation protein DedD